MLPDPHRPGGREEEGRAREGKAGPQEDEGPVGPFASWRSLYGVVIAYGLITIIILLLLTRLLDPATP